MIKQKIFEGLSRYGFYRIEDLKIGGNCGLCGEWVSKAIVPIDWPWCICEKCKEDCVQKDIK